MLAISVGARHTSLPARHLVVVGHVFGWRVGRSGVCSPSNLGSDRMFCCVIRAADAGVGASYCLDEVKVKYEVRRAFQPFTVVNFDTFFVRESL